MCINLKNKCYCIETALVPPPIPTCSLEGNRVISLILLGQFIKTNTKHSARCHSHTNFLGESCRYALASVMVCQCLKCNVLFQFTTSNAINYDSSHHCLGNTGAVLGQIATGGGADHLMEQFACVQVPSLSRRSFIQMEHSLGTALEAMVGENLLIAGQKEKQLAIQQENYHNGVPAITVVVDGGWSKSSHKHSYNANSGVGMIFGAATKALVFIGIRNKYCSVCAISARNNVTAQPHQCFRRN